MNDVDKISLLKAIPFFQNLSPTDLQGLADALEEQTCPANHEVIKEGEAGDACYLIIRGKVAILKRAEAGEVLLAVRQDGDFFGEMALLGSSPRTATVRTLQATRLMKLPREAFQRLLQSDVTISSAIAQELGQRLRDTDSKLIAALDELSRHIREREQVLLPALAERIRDLTEAQERLLREHDRLREAYLDVTRALVTLFEIRNPYDQGHSQRVAVYAAQIARRMGCSEADIESLEIAALLHDVGCLGVPDAILGKESELTEAEWAFVQRSPQYGVAVLRYLEFIRGALPIIASHRERWDGQGYPKGLVGEEIPLGARILAVAEAYDVMLCGRPYRPAKTSEEAIGILEAGAGAQWDPAVVEVFLGILEQLRAA